MKKKPAKPRLMPRLDIQHDDTKAGFTKTRVGTIINLDEYLTLDLRGGLKLQINLTEDGVEICSLNRPLIIQPYEDCIKILRKR